MSISAGIAPQPPPSCPGGVLCAAILIRFVPPPRRGVRYHGTILAEQPWALPLKYKVLPEWLHDAGGYNTQVRV